MHAAAQRHRHSPEQALRRVGEGERPLNEAWNRWRDQGAGMKGEAVRSLCELETGNQRLKELALRRRGRSSKGSAMRQRDKAPVPASRQELGASSDLSPRTTDRRSGGRES